ncbi:putative DNA double-strand break repair Rad50ATPase [uncultured virus]|uniref:Putative DNA double-strand break repair Rad50ATPase n=1 Tax=uncultured virus TaxID=340016 RepID=A0A218MKB5_9VIRU|nr:putative DNA double-strand break repair Rad50ATPase [uncultured virus]
MAYIKLKELKFSNMFSYGADNVINFDKSRITQLTAPNGSGKSSVALILQETLFNKNIKSIKKADLLNRWTKSKTWSSNLTFSIDAKNYDLNVVRSNNTTKVKLLQNGEDITEHKVLDTYKKIQKLFGLDFEVFTQLTYQSSTDLLDFLKATDTNRKKFLINLFNLEKYVDIGTQIKAKTSTTEKELISRKGELKSIDDFLKNASIPEKIEESVIPPVDESLQQQIGVLQQELNDYNVTCKNIDKNNLLLDERKNLKFDLKLEKPKLNSSLFDEMTSLQNDIASAKSRIVEINKNLKAIDTQDVCYACGQSIDNTQAMELFNKNEGLLHVETQNVENYQSQLSKLVEEEAEYKKELGAYNVNQRAVERFEQLSQLIDESLPTDFPDTKDISSKINSLRTDYDLQTRAANDIINRNKTVSAHNAKVDALIEQKTDFTNRQANVKDATLILSDKLTSLNILKKAFSTSGIVAFKLENLTKELEVTINKYLSLLSDGQFQVNFHLDKEKLNIVVVNNGVDTPIETVSGGEFSRIQTSILLAIRSLLAKLGGSSINLLFLDEITGVLDDEGKEKLIDVLQTENELNVFLISHDFTHPLIDKLSIVKKDNISNFS